MERTRTLTAIAMAIGVIGATVATAAIAAPAVQLAQADTVATGPNLVTLNKKDVQFVDDAASAGEFEIEAGKLALERSSNAGIKEFAQHMIDDHRKNGEMLKAIATKKGTTVPTTLAKREQKEFDALKAKKDGKAFDNAYCSAMLTTHKDAYGRYMGAKVDVTDIELRAYIVESLPTLKQHVEMAKALNKNKS